MKRYYNTKKITYKGEEYDSKPELDYYKSIENDSNLEITPHKKFTIIPSFKYRDKTIRSITYEADFYIMDKTTGEEIIVDIKPEKEYLWENTFKIKWKLMKRELPQYTYKIIVWDSKNKCFKEVNK